MLNRQQTLQLFLKVERKVRVLLVGRNGAATLTPEAVNLTAVKFTSDFD